MHGVGPGSVLGGRYAVRRRLVQQPRWERWSADDSALDRAVVLLCFPREAGQADATVDAARRAAGIEEPRLTRVLDVGRDVAVAFVVEEPMPDAQPLTALLSDGGLPADEVRRVVGEAATALAAASARGLHHGVLTPRNVLVMPDGSVKVRGLATEAALLGEEDLPSDQASATDAMALVGLLYAGLTGRWPLPGPDSGLEAAARVVGGVVAPSEIAAGVPRDLDLLVTGALGSGHAPLAPAEIVESLGQWSPAQVRELATERVAVLRPTTAVRTEPFARDPVSGGIRRPDPRRAPRADDSPEGGARAKAVAATAGAVVASTGSMAKGLGRGVAGALGAAGTAAGTVAGRVSSVARQTADKAAERSAARAERHRYEHLDDEFFEGQEATLSEVLEPAEDDLESPLPMLAADPVAGDRRASRLALSIVAGLVLLVALLGIWGLPKLGSGSSPGRPADSPSGTAGGLGASAGASTTVSPPLAIVGSATFDPANGPAVPATTGAKAYDGDPATVWRSSKWYGTEKFGGYEMPGLGLALDLGQPTPVRRVKVTLPVEQDGKVYIASQASLEGAKVIGSFTHQRGELSFDAPGGSRITGQLVIVFITRLGADGEGHFRAQISEVAVSS